MTTDDTKAPAVETPEPKGKPRLLGSRPILRYALFIGGCAAAGYAYYFFIGCNGGGCPITSSPYVSTGYGGLMGLLLSRS